MREATWAIVCVAGKKNCFAGLELSLFSIVFFNKTGTSTVLLMYLTAFPGGEAFSVTDVEYRLDSRRLILRRRKFVDEFDEAFPDLCPIIDPVLAVDVDKKSSSSSLSSRHEISLSSRSISLKRNVVYFY